jgi:hypothetical protein
MNAQFLFFKPGDQWAPNLRAMKAAGVETVRSDAVWAWVEPNPPLAGAHHYSWQALDPIVSALAQHGLRWTPVVDFSTPWDRAVAGNTVSPPAGIDNYAAYAAALAARYGDHGSFWSSHPYLQYLPVHSWEIWNEENLDGFWAPASDPARYTDMYLAARAAVHAVQPGATVLVGGLSNYKWAEYLTAMLARRPAAHGQFDAVAFHPYTANADDSLATVIALRHQLVALGEPNVPIAITEVGWPTAGPVNVLDDATRATNLSSLTDRLARSDCGILSISPHTWITNERDPGNAEDWYGLFHPDGTPSATEAAYSLTARALEGLIAPSGPTDALPLCGTATTGTTTTTTATTTAPPGPAAPTAAPPAPTPPGPTPHPTAAPSEPSAKVSSPPCRAGVACRRAAGRPARAKTVRRASRPARRVKATRRPRRR